MARGGAEGGGVARGPLAVCAAALLVFFLLVYLRLAPTNFGGFDEWTYLALGSRGVVSFPHSGRPFALLWTLPALLRPASFWGYYWLHGAYLLGAALLVSRIALWLAPGDVQLAYLAAALSLVWAPDSLWRIDSVMCTVNSGALLAALAAGVLAGEAWRRRSVSLGLAGAALAYVAARSYEAVLPLLALLPIALIGCDRLRPWRDGLRLSGPYAAALASAAVLAAWPLFSGARTYQLEQFDFDPRPLAVLGRLLSQLGHELRPLASAPPAGSSRAALAVVVLLVGGFVAARARMHRPRAVALAAGVGLVLVAAAGIPFALGEMGRDAAQRAQILAAPGAGLLLAAGARALGGARPALTLALGGWLALLGCGRTLGLQDVWNEVGFFPRQRASLRGLVAAVPDVVPHTLIALIDTTRGWPASFPFHHAVGYLYQGRAAGHVAGVEEPLYQVDFDAAGVRVTPDPVLQGPWGVAPERYGYDEVIVAVAAKDAVRLLLDWPAALLPPLPAPARYDPVARIRRLGVAVPERRVLDE